MTSMTTGTTVTNEQIARDLKLSDSMVSRIRSGDRFPSFGTMELIALQYHWPVADQVARRMLGEYAKSFEYRVGQHYAD